MKQVIHMNIAPQERCASTINLSLHAKEKVFVSIVGFHYYVMFVSIVGFHL